MITTSNFATSAKHPDAVAISRGVPRFYKGRRYMALAPPAWLLKAKKPDCLTRNTASSLIRSTQSKLLGSSAPMPSFSAGSRLT